MANTFIVRFSSKFQERLERLAEKTKKPVSLHIGNMLGLYLDEYEEACLALDRSSGKNATYYTSRDVRKLLQLLKREIAGRESFEATGLNREGRAQEDNMKIEISKTQYKTLVKALFLANWVINCHRTDEPDDEFERLEQYILSQGKFFDFKNAEFDEKHGKYYHDRDFETKTVKLLDNFVDLSFWDELTERMAERDFVNSLGEKTILKMTREERFTKFFEFADPYETEFSENGIDNLVLRSDSKE